MTTWLRALGQSIVVVVVVGGNVRQREIHHGRWEPKIKRERS